MANVETLRLVPLKPAHRSGYSAFILSDDHVDRREIVENERQSKLEEDQPVREEIKSPVPTKKAQSVSNKIELVPNDINSVPKAIDKHVEKEIKLVSEQDKPQLPESIQSVRDEIKTACQSQGQADPNWGWDRFTGWMPLAEDYFLCGTSQIRIINNSESKEPTSPKTCPASSWNETICEVDACKESTSKLNSLSMYCGVPTMKSIDSEDSEKRRIGEKNAILSDALALSSALTYFAEQTVSLPVLTTTTTSSSTAEPSSSAPTSPIPLRHSSPILPPRPNARTPLKSRTPPSRKNRSNTAVEGFQMNNDDQSAFTSSTSSTLGSSIFTNCVSLPSISDMATPTGNDIDDESSTASQDLATLSIDSAVEKLESLADEKMKKIDEKEIIGDVPQSAAALIRQSSSLSLSSNRSSSNRSLSLNRSLSFRRKRNKNRTEKDNKLSISAKSKKLANNPKNKKLGLARELRAIVEEHGRYNIKFANVTLLLAAVYEDEKDYDVALKLYREAISIYSTKLGDHNNTTVDSKVLVAKLLDKMKEYQESIRIHCDVLNMRQALFGQTDPRIPDTMSFIANTMKKQGRLIQAIKELKRALKLYRTALGDSHPLVTNTVDEISSLYLDAGNYEKATAILEEVVKLKAGTAGINTMDVANTLEVLANAYESAEDRQNELRTLKKCYSVYSVVCGESSEEATTILERLAANYRTLGDVSRSVTAYLALLHTRKHCLGNTHPLVAKTYLYLGKALRENGKPEKARRCMKQALSICVGEGKHISDIGMIAEVMHEMALNSVDMGDNSGALKIFKQELAIRRKMGKKENRRKAVTLHHLGTTEICMRNNNKALNFFMEALSIYEKMDDEVGISFAKTLYCTGIVFEATRNQDRATETFEESIKILEGQGLSKEEVKEIVANMDKLRAIAEKTPYRKRFGR
eukprot:CAMPEP_0194130914 /NCGR_PEP_ID=MMETSP0152-20130528/1816_1 /TAXON_ID=1049557 /ORGANISM="Thalassiothrix antarctica, Strain L6-D1" /LENGTH=924 /DNA_ID=CAMNT_0038825551 /DNA_START=133 /DNA_END=2907 /DNA_ORIENTATION=-